MSGSKQSKRSSARSSSNEAYSSKPPIGYLSDFAQKNADSVYGSKPYHSSLQEKQTGTDQIQKFQRTSGAETGAGNGTENSDIRPKVVKQLRFEDLVQPTVAEQQEEARLSLLFIYM